MRAALKIGNRAWSLMGRCRLFEVGFIIELIGAFLLGKEEKNLSLNSLK